MCSFLFARTATMLSDSSLQAANEFARHRGPDRTTVRRMKDGHGRELSFLHNLLDISGFGSSQPIIHEAGGQQFVALFNGEIYNFREFGSFASDTECLLPAYRRFGPTTASKLDGEFAIVIYDPEKQSLLIFSDPFLTKPIYLGTSGSSADFGVATCASSLMAIGLNNVKMAEPNTAYEIHFQPNGQAIEKLSNVTDFCLNQRVCNYDDWTTAFLESVRKRACHGAHRPVVFLSSGYDSGAICLALNLQGIEYDTFSIEAGEERRILNQRIRMNRAASCGTAFRVQGLTAVDLDRMTSDIQRNVEAFLYQHEDQPGVVTTLQADGGALGANFLAELARKNARLVNLSGAGADEILSDYGFAGNKFYYHSEFGGLFPDQLETIFPWKKFYGDTQRSYLFKDEFILGRHGIEGRYPFLDRSLVQQFLWLSAALKNRTYKAPLEHFLSMHGYPFEPMKKRGFAPRRVNESLLARLRARFAW